LKQLRFLAAKVTVNLRLQPARRLRISSNACLAGDHHAVTHAVMQWRFYIGVRAGYPNHEKNGTYSFRWSSNTDWINRQCRS